MSNGINPNISTTCPRSSLIYSISVTHLAEGTRSAITFISTFPSRNNGRYFYRYSGAHNAAIMKEPYNSIHVSKKVAFYSEELQTLICRRHSLCWRVFLRGDYYSLFIQMFENCSAGANSKLISGPFINMHEGRRT